MKLLYPYGQCPQCGEMRQPPDFREKDNTEFCYCCDCRIMWLIVHTEFTDSKETHENIYEIIDVEKFQDSFTPHDCRELPSKDDIPF